MSEKQALSFKERVYAATKDIPKGYVTTYGAIARRIDSPDAVRAVGTALRLNPTPIVIPCHRVIKADLSLGKYYGANAVIKQELLQNEGVMFTPTGKVRREHLWTWG